ncbi:MAG: hypothetical protein LBS28_00520 [Streptococcaceae bacterium]|jgi:hypothetical protein|nr:hypothetical protein [Streptococcaceae bacterium]
MQKGGKWHWQMRLHLRLDLADDIDEEANKDVEVTNRDKREMVLIFTQFKETIKPLQHF